MIIPVHFAEQDPAKFIGFRISCQRELIVNTYQKADVEVLVLVFVASGGDSMNVNIKNLGGQDLDGRLGQSGFFAAFP